MSVLKKQAQATFRAIEMMALCEMKDGNDYIIEGYHLELSFVHKLVKKYGTKKIQAIFLTKFDAEKFSVDVHKSTTPNDWLLLSVKKKETFLKVGEMVAVYSRLFEKDAKKYGFESFVMDINFEKQIKEVIKYFKK